MVGLSSGPSTVVVVIGKSRKAQLFGRPQKKCAPEPAKGMRGYTTAGKIVTMVANRSLTTVLGDGSIMFSLAVNQALSP